MSPKPDRWIRLWSPLSRRRLEREVNEEMDFHLEMRTREYMAEGLSPAEARRKAEERFGAVEEMKRTAVKTELRRVQNRKRTLYMDGFKQDLRFAFRQLWRRPAFSLVALTMLAVGIGANTAIFSVVHSILLRPLPFQDPDRIVQIWESRVEQGWNQSAVAPANFWDFRELNRSFEDLGGFRFSSTNLTGFEHPERLAAGQVSAGFFGRVLGVRPVLGRTFLPGEDDPATDAHLVLLGNEFWHNRFGGDPAILGTTLTLDGEPYTVVGILPRGRPWLDYSDVYLPMIRRPDDPRTSFELAVIGRLREGVTFEAGLSDLESVARRLEESYPQDLAGIGIAMEPANNWVAAPETRRAIWILVGAVGFLLMIACVNLANLFLARATGRVRETAIRAAAGAGRGRLIRQALTESLLVSLLGAALGLGLALLCIDAMMALDTGNIPGLAQVDINGPVLLFTLMAGVVTGVVTGLVPALQSSGDEAALTLRSGGSSIAGNRLQQRLRGVLVGSEIALSLILLIGAGLLVQSFSRLLNVDRGFESENRLVMSVNIPESYGNEETLTFLRQFLQRVSALPPVQSAAAVSVRPLAGGSTGLGIVTPEDPAPEGGIPWATWRLISPGYFETLGVPILKGRDFTPEEQFPGEGAAIPILVSERLSELLWPGENPLGRTASLWAGQNDRPGQVIGVVGDMRERGIERDPTLAVYLPYLGGWPPELVIHTRGNPTAIVPALRAALEELDPNLPLSDISTMEDMVGDSVGGQRFMMTLVGFFAFVALLLALAGVYGVQAYTVARQTPEIGVRVAMGASNGQILKGIIGQAMKPAMVGVAMGLGGAFALSRLMTGMLFEVEATDVPTYAAVAGVLAFVALVSCWIPARRALKVDPVIAFRSD